jgi:hypothetical protein
MSNKGTEMSQDQENFFSRVSSISDYSSIKDIIGCVMEEPGSFAVYGLEDIEYQLPGIKGNINLIITTNTSLKDREDQIAKLFQNISKTPLKEKYKVTLKKKGPDYQVSKKTERSMIDLIPLIDNDFNIFPQELRTKIAPINPISISCIKSLNENAKLTDKIKTIKMNNRYFNVIPLYVHNAH